MNITFIPIIDINEIEKEMGIVNFPFTDEAENNSYVKVELDQKALEKCQDDIDYSKTDYEKQCAANLFKFIYKMNLLGYDNCILIHIH